MLWDHCSVHLSVVLPIVMEVGLGPGDIVLDGDPAHTMQRGTAAPPSHFSAHVYCGQMVAHLSNC